MKDKNCFNGHPLWATVQRLLESEKVHDLPSDTKEYLLYLLKDLESRHDSTNPFYVSKDSLDKINTKLKSIETSPSSNRLSIIDGAIGDCFNILAKEWPAYNGRRTADIQQSTYDAYIADANEKIESSREAADRVEELEATYKSEAEKTRQSVGALEDEARSALAEIENESREKTGELIEQLDATIANFEKTTSESTNSIKSEYVDKLKALNAEADELLEKVKARSNSISGWVIADSYGKYARNKTTATFAYDAFAIIFAVCGIILVAFVLAGFHADDVSVTVFKFAVSVATFTVSGFLFRRGTFNQRESKAAKRTELTLRQYEPFIANLEKEEQQRITKDIADRIFIKGEIGGEDESTLAGAIANKGLNDNQLALVVEIVRALTKDS